MTQARKEAIYWFDQGYEKAKKEDRAEADRLRRENELLEQDCDLAHGQNERLRAELQSWKSGETVLTTITTSQSGTERIEDLEHEVERLRKSEVAAWTQVEELKDDQRRVGELEAEVERLQGVIRHAEDLRVRHNQELSVAKAELEAVKADHPCCYPRGTLWERSWSWGNPFRPLKEGE